jgi:hypothetical protein
MKVLTKEQWDNALENYKFSCRKTGGRYERGQYNKSYIFPISARD